jgi:hypothetical protein
MRLPYSLLFVLLAICALPAAASADAAWTCGAQTGWLAAGGQRVDSPKLGGEPCPSAQAAAAGASGSPGSLTATGTVTVDGGTSSQTIDARKPQATVQAKSLAIHNADDSLVLTSSDLRSQANGACDQNRQPSFTSSGTPGTVTLNARPIDASKDYSEPGVGVNGAPLFGKITIHFNEVAKTDTALMRRAIHVVVTDRDGAVVFDAVGGEVSVGRDGAVCEPPPVCPPGTEPQAGRCVDVSVTPLPPASPLPPSPPPVTEPTPGSPSTPNTPTDRQVNACRDVDARVGQVSAKRLALATLCLMNVQRKAHHLRKLRSDRDLSRAARSPPISIFY